jgi:hypothetical protein
MVPRRGDAVGAVADPVFGPVIAVTGGVTVELTRDVAVRVAPLTDLDADEMVRSLATFPLLDGFRGAEKADVAALADVVLRLGAIATTHDAIAEMDCNPVIVSPSGAVVVDARISVQTWHPQPSGLAARVTQVPAIRTLHWNPLPDGMSSMERMKHLAERVTSPTSSGVPRIARGPTHGTCSPAPDRLALIMRVPAERSPSAGCRHDRGSAI